MVEDVALAKQKRSWSEYLLANRGRGIRPTLNQAATSCEEAVSVERVLFAVDLGCGSGADTIALLKRGWRVLAVDGEAEAIEYLNADVPPEVTGNLETRVQRFQDVELPECDLLHAGFSLPFCPPDDFPELWRKIRESERPGARFAGQFFGPRDTWAANPRINSQTVESVAELTAGWLLEECREEEGMGSSLAGEKYWHVIHVIAHRPK